MLNIEMRNVENFPVLANMQEELKTELFNQYLKGKMKSGNEYGTDIAVLPRQFGHAIVVVKRHLNDYRALKGFEIVRALPELMISEKLEITLEPTLLVRHRPNSILSYFEGSKEELTELTSCACKLANKIKPGRTRDTKVLLGANPSGFVSRDGAFRNLLDRGDPERAVRVDLVIRIERADPLGFIERIELIDFQAWSAREVRMLFS